MPYRFTFSTFLATCGAGWERHAMRELRKGLPEATCRSLFMPGNLLVNTPLPREQALAVLDELDTRHVAHITPLDLREDINRHPASVAKILQAALQLRPLDPGYTFRVRCNRRGHHDFGSREVEHYVGTDLSDIWGVTPDLANPEQIISVEIFQDLAFLGNNWPDELLHKDLIEIRRYAPGERPLNRAEKKLREALLRFKPELAPGCRALDLGAAPGGWTRTLAETCAEVVAVDPGELDQQVTQLPNVTYFRQRWEDYISQAAGEFDLITCDMNRPPVEAATALCMLAPRLRPGGSAILTIKFQTRKRKRHVAEALQILAACYEQFQVSQLPHNGKETTAYMKKK